MQKSSGNSTEIQATRYYQIINLNSKFALYLSSGSEEFEKEKAYLTEPNERSLGQVWQVVRIPDNLRFSNCYEIVHTRSTFVLTRMKTGEVKIKFGDWESSQLFRVQMPQNEETFRFVGYQNAEHLLHYDNGLKLGPISRDDKKCKWILQPCLGNFIINGSCYLENAFTNLVIDVPRASLDDGCAIIQYHWNNRFNQRFKFFLSNGHYRIANLNSKLFITAAKKCREGDKITQEEEMKTKQQEWILEYQGRNLYLIRSAFSPDMMIGIKEASLKDTAPLITTMNAESCLWKIMGYLPHRNQLSEF